MRVGGGRENPHPASRAAVLVAWGGGLAAVAAAIQLIPTVLSEAVVFVTAFSALPVYLAARSSVGMGTLTYLAAGLLTMLVSLHEALFFSVLNGPLGLLLGIGRRRGRLMSCLLSGVALSCGLNLLTFPLGIHVFGIPLLPESSLLRLAALTGFSFAYSSLYLYLAETVFRSMQRAYPRLWERMKGEAGI